MEYNYDVSYLSTEFELKKLKKLLKIDNDNLTGVVLPKKLKSNDYIICLIDKNNSKIISFVWFGIYKDNEFNKNYIGINYSYTFIKFRSNGYNTKLKILIEKFGKDNNIDHIKSIPFESSKSKNILLSLGFNIITDYYIKKINF